MKPSVMRLTEANLTLVMTWTPCDAVRRAQTTKAAAVVHCKLFPFFEGELVIPPFGAIHKQMFSLASNTRRPTVLEDWLAETALLLQMGVVLFLSTCEVLRDVPNRTSVSIRVRAERKVD